MIVKLLTEHHLEFLSLKGGCTGLSESTHVKMPHCWKSHVVAHMRMSVHARPEGERKEGQDRYKGVEPLSKICKLIVGSRVVTEYPLQNLLTFH